MAASIPLASGATIPLAPGYKFNPTDQDLVVRYLRCRAVNYQLSSAIIADKDILDHHPSDLVSETGSEKFFFYRRVLRSENDTRWKRTAKHGYWRASGKEVPIFCTSVSSGVPLMVGIKRTLVFYHGKPPSGERTDWVMREYCLAGGGLSPYRMMRPCMKNNSGHINGTVKVTSKEHYGPSVTPHITAPSIENVNIMVNPDSSWVICRIHKKKARKPTIIIRANNNAGVEKIRFYDFLGQGNHDDGTASSSATPMENSEVKGGSSENASTEDGI